MSNVRALASCQRACVRWPCTRLAGAACRGPSRGAFVGSQSHWLFGCIVVPRRKEHGAEAPRRARHSASLLASTARRESKGTMLRFGQLAIRNRMQTRAIEGSFKSLIFVSPAARRIVTGRHASKGMRASEPSSNPSIEGTSNIRLRRLSAAPHVKR